MNCRGSISPFLALTMGMLILASCSQNPENGAGAASTNAPIVIEPRLSVGKIHAGMSRQDVIGALGEPQRTAAGALEYTRLGFAALPGRDGRIQVVMCGDVTGLNGPLVKAFTGRTPEGIGMNSTRDEIVKAYGAADDSQRFSGGAESLHYISRGLTFTLEGGKVHHIIVRFNNGTPDRTINLDPPPKSTQ